MARRSQGQRNKERRQLRLGRARPVAVGKGAIRYSPPLPLPVDPGDDLDEDIPLEELYLDFVGCSGCDETSCHGRDSLEELVACLTEKGRTFHPDYLITSSPGFWDTEKR